MVEPLETIKFREHTIKIHQDEDPMNPREEFSSLGTMMCFHKRYTLGDKNIPSIDPSDFGSWAEMREHLERKYDAAVILPLFLYDHSGITMSVGDFADRWDSGQVGFIYATRAQIRYWFMGYRVTAKRLRQAETLLKAEVKTYDDYLTGRVYGYTIEDSSGREWDSCWGFFGDTKDLVEECKAVINNLEPKRGFLAQEVTE